MVGLGLLSAAGSSTPTEAPAPRSAITLCTTAGLPADNPASVSTTALTPICWLMRSPPCSATTWPISGPPSRPWSPGGCRYRRRPCARGRAKAADLGLAEDLLIGLHPHLALLLRRDELELRAPRVRHGFAGHERERHEEGGNHRRGRGHLAHARQSYQKGAFLNMTWVLMSATGASLPASSSMLTTATVARSVVTAPSRSK